MPESLAGEPLRPSIRRRELGRVECGDARDPAMRESPIRISPLGDAAKITRPLFEVVRRNDPHVPYAEGEPIVARRRRRHDGPLPARREQAHGFAPKEGADLQCDASPMFMAETLPK
jgi:hypothetical protein